MKLFSAIGFSFFLFLIFPGLMQAQSMTDLFLSLPSYCTPRLNGSGRKSLVKDTEYTVTAHKEEDEIDYSIDTVTANYMAYEYSNSKGQGTNENYEMKRFKSADGKSILYFSKTGDPRVRSNKYILKTYDISGNSLIENFRSFIPQDLDFKVFLKFETPDSVKASIEKTCYYTFDLDAKSSDKILFHIILQSDKDEQWLTGNTMVFTWTGNMFTSTFIFVKDE
jgi:hypothetical protein